jgi:hypothetical protein
VTRKSAARKPKLAAPRAEACGLCGSKTKPLTRTPCCENVICDDAADYELFSYARNSCHRNHDRYTLCSHHFNEEHEGRWQDCGECLQSFPTEMYVWFGTNEYNFTKLENPPEFKPTHCARCSHVIRLSTDGYLISEGKYYCERCGDKLRRQTTNPGRSLKKSNRR